MRARLTVAAELTNVIRTLQLMLESGERLAQASGGMVNPVHFRAAQTAMTLAAGDLDSKGLLIKASPAEEKAP